MSVSSKGWEEIRCNKMRPSWSWVIQSTGLWKKRWTRIKKIYKSIMFHVAVGW